MDLDEKQRRLIDSWICYGTTGDGDPYLRFMSLWVAFNAICYAKYAALANRNCADLGLDNGLAAVADQPTPLIGPIVSKAGRVKLEIEQPGRITITIRQRYTEAKIFSQFAKEFQPRYEAWLSDRIFEERVLSFREALRKGGRYYVVNMVHAAEHAEGANYEDMKRRNVIVPFEDHKDLKQLKNTLYQVRSTVFHGQKLPNDVNDD